MATEGGALRPSSTSALVVIGGGEGRASEAQQPGVPSSAVDDGTVPSGTDRAATGAEVAAPPQVPQPLRRRGRPTKQQLQLLQGERRQRGEPPPPPPPPPLSCTALPRGAPTASVAAIAAYAWAALPIPDQMSKKLRPAAMKPRFSQVKTTIPVTLLEAAVQVGRGRPRKNPYQSFILPSGARVPLDQPIHPNCLDEWLGSYWYMREYQQHKPEYCPAPKYCKRHSSGTHTSSITLRARLARPKYKYSVPPTISEVELYTLSISGTVVVHCKADYYPLLILVRPTCALVDAYMLVVVVVVVVALVEVVGATTDLVVLASSSSSSDGNPSKDRVSSALGGL